VSEGKKLDLKELEDINLSEYVNHVKGGTTDEIENELMLLGGIKSIVPLNMAHLSEEEFVMCMLMYSNDVECDYTNKKTEGDIVSSFIMTFIESESQMGKTIRYLVKNTYKLEEKVTKFIKQDSMTDTGDIETLKKEYTEKYVISNMTNYMRLKSQAYAFWTNNNLKQYRKLMKDLLNGGISEIERFEDRIYDEAMNSDDPTIRARYASIYSKNKGLDKSKGGNVVNMFHYGGKETANQLHQVSGNNVLEIDDILNADSIEMLDKGGNDNDDD